MSTSDRAIFTIGYQGKTIDDVLAELRAANIELLLDIRRISSSRKPGFSKTKLAERLTAGGIAYHHYVDLGMPRDLMKQRSTTDNTPILTAYRAYLTTVPQLVAEVTDLAQAHRACLFCFEANVALCHRVVLAEEISARTGLPVVHL